MKYTKAQLESWARDRFNMGYGPWCTLIVLVTGFRLYRLPMLRTALDEVMRSQEDRGAGAALLVLERKGLAERAVKGGPHNNQAAWVPTARALKMVPELAPLAKAGELAAAEEGRKAG